MDKKCRGIACIINVIKMRGHEPRYGTNMDRDQLTELFTWLDFEVIAFNGEFDDEADDVVDDGDDLRAEVSYSYLSINSLTDAC